MSGRQPRFFSRRNARGFTLLEAIVAMVVFTLGAFALYGWLSTNVITLTRISQRQEQEVAFASALDLVRRSNPMEVPRGKRVIGDMTVTWRSYAMEDPKPNAYQDGSPGNYLMGIYTVYVDVRRNDRFIGKFHVRQIGWKQTGKLEL